MVIDIANDHLLTSSYDASIKMWSLSTGKILRVITGINKSDCTVKISNGSHYFYTWYSNTVKVFDAARGTLLYELGGGERFNREKATIDIISDVTISPDEKYIAASSSDHTVKVWDLKTGKKIYSLIGDSWGLSALDFSPDSRYVAAVSSLGKIAIWNIAAGKLIDTLKTRPLGGQFYFSATSNKICTETTDGKIIVYDIALKKIIAQFMPAEKNDFNSAAFSVGDRYLVTNGQFQSTVWDMRTLKKIITIPQEQYSIVQGIIDNTNKEVFVVSSDGVCHIYSLPGGKESGSFTFGDNSIPDLDQASEGKLPAIGNSFVHVYNTFIEKDILLTPVDNKDYVIKSDSSWYSATPDAARWLSWKAGKNIYDFDQWDLQYNRPDKVLEALGNTDTALITAYKNAWLKRLRKMKIDTLMFRDDYHLPETAIINRSEVEGISNSGSAKLTIRCYETDLSNRIKKLFVTINGDPIYGADGLDITTSVSDTTFVIPVLLNSGQNTIKVSCLNNRAAESLREVAYINYEPVSPVRRDVYYIGIGVSKYKDSANNLRYADKDVNDIANAIKTKYPGAIVTMLTNEKATKENIKSLKQQLLNCKPDDKVIISLSGHGVIDKNYDFYFATNDIDFKNPSVKGLGYDDIEWLLDSIPARNKLVLMDACHSGEFDKEGSYLVDVNSHPADNNVKEVRGMKIASKDSSGAGLKNTFEIMQDLFANIGRGNGATVISAAAGTEFAYEGNSWANGVFTYCVLQGLVESKSDTDKDGIITVTELKEYVSEAVNKLTSGRQRPTSRQINFDNNWEIW